MGNLSEFASRAGYASTVDTRAAALLNNNNPRPIRNKSLEMNFVHFSHAAAEIK